MSGHPVLIGVDWGTSSFRAYLIGHLGDIIDRIETKEGILSVQNNDFESVFERLMADWFIRYPGLPVLLSGMITSRNGWFETDYVPLPARIESIASAMSPFETGKGRKIHFVTGLVQSNTGAAPDVIRGEETELIGQLCHHQGDGLFLLPGTHSKWVQTADSCINGFQTFITGEIYAILKQHSILGRLMVDGEENLDAFDRGVKARIRNPVSILHSLFSVRTLPLFRKISAVDVADYLSGLLIAEEIFGALDPHNTADAITVIGRNDLTGRYCRALAIMDLKATAVDQGMVSRGHFELARRRELI